MHKTLNIFFCFFYSATIHLRDFTFTTSDIIVLGVIKLKLVETYENKLGKKAFSFTKKFELFLFRSLWKLS